MRRVILESPFAAPTPEGVQANIDYARRCVRDSLLRGEAPIASHLLYTQPGILDDNAPAERQHGIDAGLAWRTVAERSVVYVDRGISKGMKYGIKAAIEASVPVEYRRLDVTSCAHETWVTGSNGVYRCAKCMTSNIAVLLPKGEWTLP